MKKIIILFTVCLLFILFFGLDNKAQKSWGVVANVAGSSMLQSGNKKSLSTITWKTIVDTLQVKISYSLSECSGKDRIFLRIENNSADSLLLSWGDNLTSGSSSFSNAGNSQGTSLHISPNKVIEGTCEQSVTERLLCLPVDLYLRGAYDVNNLNYSITGFTKSIL